MESNFKFLDDYWGELYSLGKKAELQAHKDYNNCVITIGIFAEKLIDEIINAEHLQQYNDLSQFEKIEKLNELGLLKTTIVDKLHKIRILRNKTGHGEIYATEIEAENMLKDAYDLGVWFFKRYSDKCKYITSFTMPSKSNNLKVGKKIENNEIKNEPIVETKTIVKKVYDWKVIIILSVLLAVSVIINIFLLFL